MNTSPLLSDDTRAGTCHARARRPPSTRSSRFVSRASRSTFAPSTPSSRYVTPFRHNRRNSPLSAPCVSRIICVARSPRRRSSSSANDAAAPASSWEDAAPIQWWTCIASRAARGGRDDDDDDGGGEDGEEEDAPVIAPASLLALASNACSTT
jgi:hypothetical protein